MNNEFEDLQLSQVSFKGSHNSYEFGKNMGKLLDFDPSAPWLYGCRAIELDIWRHSSAFDPGKSISETFFTVSHTNPNSNNYLSEYLASLLNWRSEHPGSGPVVVMIDIKSSGGSKETFPDEIDTYLKCYFDAALIFQPSKLQQPGTGSLCESVIQYGWPTLGELKNQFLFCLTGNSSWKSYYASTLPTNAGRFCYSDRDESDDDPDLQPPTKGEIVFFNFHIYHSNRENWMQAIPRFARENLLVRTWKANSADNWNDSISCGATMPATDELTADWAKVGNGPYARRRS